MEEKVLKTKTVLNKMLSLIDDEYGVEGWYYAAHILQCYECILTENGFMNGVKKGAEDKGDCGRVVTRFEKWRSYNVKDTDLPDYESCLVLASAFGCEVRDFVITDFTGAETDDDGRKPFEFFASWYTGADGGDGLSLEIGLPRIRGKLKARKSGGIESLYLPEYKDNFSVALNAANEYRRACSGGRSALDLASDYAAKNKLNGREPELVKLLNNVETVWRRRDRTPPVMQLVVFEAVTGIPLNRMYKEETEKIKCKLESEELQRMSSFDGNPLESLKADNLLKDKVKVLCGKRGYEIISGARDQLIIGKDGKYGLIAVSGGDYSVITPRYDYIVKNNDIVCAINGDKVFKLEKQEGALENKAVSFGARTDAAAAKAKLGLALRAVDAIVNKGYKYFETDGKLWTALPAGGGILRTRIEKARFAKGKTITTVERGKKLYGLMVSGGFVIPPLYEEEIRESEGFYLVRKNGKYGFLNAYGAEAVPCVYEDASPFSEGLASVGRDGKYGYINQSGETAIEEQFVYACDFAEGLAPVSVLRGDGIVKDGYIDKSGTLVIEAVFDSAYRFSEGIAAVEAGGKFGYTDSRGKIVVPMIYGAASLCRNRTVKVLSGDKLISKKIG